MNTTATKLFPLCAAILLAGCIPASTRNSPQPAAPLQTVNVAGSSLLTVSNGDWLKDRAIDGHVDTWWSADGPVPQWLEVDFGLSRLVTKIEFVVSQVRAGPATHILIAKRHGKTVVWHRFDTPQAADGRAFALKLDPPQRIDTVRLLTTRHEGWVAIRELRVMAPLPAATSVLASGLLQPVYLTHAGDGSGRLFVVEREGRIRVIKDGILAKTPFLDISTRVASSIHRGLLGLAFPPSYAQDGHFYVSYVSAGNQNSVSRFSVSSDPNLADPDSEHVVLAFHQPGDRHSIGTLSFGPLDRYLYVAVGDGKLTSPPDLSQDAQDSGKLLGKILRIDVASGVGPYAIPPDNPFVSTPGFAPEIWALGLRNPWGIAFDHNTGHLYIPDTGQNTTEEINFHPAGSPAGRNYGWPFYEGWLRYAPSGHKGNPSDFTSPVAHFSRADGCAVVGGAVVDNAFYYADFCRGTVWQLQHRAGAWLTVPILSLGVPISSIGAGEDGTLYASGYADGKIYRITPHYGTDGGNASSPN
ncbi:MAG: PQQ-dependent sugar dehydrogenase [Caldilineaceae bacterium]|nr:PQQ-dependent sugar dehydrogenase [Caldilineaceae bacterium]